MATGIHFRYFTTGDYGGFFLLAGKRKQTEASLESSSFICVRMGIDRIGRWLLTTIHRLSYIIFCGRLEKSVFILGIVKKLTEKRIREFLKKGEGILSLERDFFHICTCLPVNIA